MGAVPSGSYLAISHGASDILDPEQTAEAVDRVNQLSYQQYTFRSHADALRFFNGLELVEPGVAQAQKWRPDIEN